jgi:hypothetical protein
MSTRKWRFFRAGGFDQVSIETGVDLLALGELDQKLWVALSCPVKNLEFDTRMLEFLDSDHDGHIRAPEIIEAVTWAGSVLKDPEVLVNGKEGMPLSAINDETEEGKRLLMSARHILKNLGKENVTVISVEDTKNEETIFAQMSFNGDGIVPAHVTDDPAVRSVIVDIMDCLGAEMDRSGHPGVSQEKSDLFFAEAKAYSEWQEKVESDPSILALGAQTQESFEILNALRDKVNDYFIRCRLAEFDERSALESLLINRIVRFISRCPCRAGQGVATHRGDKPGMDGFDGTAERGGDQADTGWQEQYYGGRMGRLECRLCPLCSLVCRKTRDLH